MSEELDKKEVERLKGLKNKERMAIPRQKMPEQEAEERAKNFCEVPFGLPDMTAVLEANRCIKCKDPKCIEGCPVGIDIPAFIERIAQGDFLGGIRKMKETNMLPAICGRVCPQEEQCEKVCLVGKGKRDPVAIGRLERFVADWDRAQGKVETPPVGKPTGKSVGIVGSGPAGLTVAADLRRAGHEVVLYEALHAPGGVLMYGIPEFRLPKEIVNAEVEVLEKMGVKFLYNQVIGMTQSLEELLQKHDAVFLGTGAGLPWFMGIPGENLAGIYSANEYLTRSNLMKAYDFPNADTPIARSRRVAVVGGGNVAMDAARTARRLGAEVWLIYRRTEKEMPARNEEIEHAKEEGIIFKILHNPTRYLGDEKGRVTQMECLRMELGEPDASGRRRPVPIKGSEFLIDVDTVVVAIGNGPNPLIPQTTTGLEVNERKGTIKTNLNTMRTSKKGVFAGGDIAIGAATVILAMGHGRTAARSINHYLETGVWDIEHLPGEEPKDNGKEKKS